MSFSMPPSAASSSLRQAGFALEGQAPDRGGRRGEEHSDDDTKAKYDSLARKRSISGSGDDAA